MSITTKILLALLAVIVLVAGGFIIYQQHEISAKQSDLQTSIVAQQQLVDGIVRSQSTYATKDDIAKFASDNDVNLKAIQDNLSSLGASLSALNVFNADSTAQTQTGIKSSGTGTSNPTTPGTSTTVSCSTGGTATCLSTDPFGFMAKQQLLMLNEDFPGATTTTTTKIPIGSVGFSAWQANPWSYNIDAREYNVDTTLATTSNGQQLVYNKFSVKIGDVSYDVPIKNSTTKQELPTASWSFFNPRLYAGIDGMINTGHLKGDFVPQIDFGLISYGQTKTNPTLSLLEVGVGVATVDKQASFVLTPIAYNIGQKFFSPYINNTYIAPSISVQTDGTIAVGAGLRIGF